MTTNEKSMVTLASKMMLTPSQAVALPAAIEVVAKTMKASESQAIFALMTNSAAREYVAGICRTVS